MTVKAQIRRVLYRDYKLYGPGRRGLASTCTAATWLNNYITYCLDFMDCGFAVVTLLWLKPKWSLRWVRWTDERFFDD
jgi:hypothetical protein